MVTMEEKEKDEILEEYKDNAKTEIAKALLKLRKAYIESGKKFLSNEELEEEIRKLARD